MGHDELFKALLEGHFQGFLELFFPDVARSLDFRTLQFLDKEVFIDFPEGSRREADVVAQLETFEGQPELVVIHVEVQDEPRNEVRERMFHYFTLLGLRYKYPVFPIVMYVYRGYGLSEEEYRVVLFGRELLRFRFMSIGLAKLKAEEYVEKSPLGAALSALMSRAKGKAGLELRASMLRRIVESGLNEARTFQLVNVVETYFEIKGKQAESFRRLLSRKGYREVEEMELTWADKMMEKGRQRGLTEGLEKGREEGLREGKRKTLIRLLTAKFGALPQGTISRIEGLESVDELDSYLERVLTAGSLEEMEI